MNKLFCLPLWIFTFFAVPTYASIIEFRWTENANANLENVLDLIQQNSGIQLSRSDFLLLEERYLANSLFKMYVQTSAGIPILGASIRTWTNPESGEGIQVEAHIENKKPQMDPRLKDKAGSVVVGSLIPQFAKNEIMAKVHEVVKQDPTDNQVRSIKASDYWENGKLIRLIKVRAKRGIHEFKVSLANLQILKHTYIEFAQADMLSSEFSVPAKVFTVYEETAEHRVRQKPVDVELKYIHRYSPQVKSDPYEILRQRRYLDAQYDSLLGTLPQGQAAGLWSSASIKRQGFQILNQLPLIENSFSNGGVILDGRYATISLHPDAVKKFEGLNFNPTQGAQLRFDWIETSINDVPTYEMLLKTGFNGKRLTSLMDAYNRPIERHPSHDPVTYINQGFDEVQVYYAITSLFESLRSMGFTDPDLSTRPFNAFLYDPDISMKDNAYYTEDTINFTTYSADQQNYARDNSTIWHELGHGIMDRLMGEHIQLADTGGLSEGMADFLASLVIADVTKGETFEGWDEFRIINQIRFNMTNEVHDDGEAYGGAMKDLLDAAMKKEGKLGLHKVTDLTLEAMRLSRNHPALTANKWFEQMLFADQLGRSGLRRPGELRSLILAALNERNFSLTGQKVADFSLKNGDTEVLAGVPGSRQRPITVSIAANEIASYLLQVQLIDGDVFQFHYPVQVRVQLQKGPLQGGIHWVGEEAQSQWYTIEKAGDILPISLRITGTCDEVNRDDGSCVDYAYIQIYNHEQDSKPIAKKRFYLRLKTRN